MISLFILADFFVHANKAKQLNPIEINITNKY